MRPTRLLVVAPMLLWGCATAAAPTPTVQPPTATPPPSATATASLTPSVTPTLAPSTTPTPTWVQQGPRDVQVPILMYHHIAVSPIGSRYYVPPDKFESELKLLHDWGYQTITTTQLVEAITDGALLPPRPLILTFDDANEDNYTNAFPIMERYGFKGVLYVPYDYIGTHGYLSVANIEEMAAAGWEVGSHTLSHPANFLALDSEGLRAEIVDSREQLQALLDLPILTFAYPFGETTESAVDYVHFAGYIAGMGATGFTADQGTGNLFVLQRCEIKGSDDAKTMTRFLPWLGDPAFLPTDTPTVTPRPTRTPIPTYTQYPTRTPPGSPSP
jgi:peptidoglycan/xylan/chitin deacetylase (PgdA/CDA1 family)